MADEKIPRAKVETAGEEAPRPPRTDGRADGSSGDAASQGLGDVARDGVGRLRDWVARSFPGHEHAFWGGVCGLLAAVLLFLIGPWRAIVVVVLVTLGVAVGQAVDGDARIVRALRRFFSRNQ